MVVCKFFLQGECKFGESCRFDHQFPTGGITAPGNQQPFQSNQNRNQTFVAKPANEVDTNTLITSVHNDMVSVEKSGQWLLTCYAPFKEKQLFPGFLDQSFEEIRLACYEAQKTNTFEQYKQQLQQALIDARTKFKALQTPTKEMVEILRNIYNTHPPAPANNTSNVNSAFGNKPTYGLPANNTFGQNSPTQIGNQNSTSLFGQNNAGQNPSIFGQQTVNQNSAGIFGQQNKTGIFGQQNATNGTFTQNTNQANSTSIFANANKNLFNATNPNQNAKDPFANSPQQPNSFQQTNQSIFSAVGGQLTQNIFAANNQNRQFGTSSNVMTGQVSAPQGQLFGQIAADNNQSVQNKPDFAQSAANSQFLNQQSNTMFATQNPHQSSSVAFGQNANSVLNSAQPQPGSVFSRLGQQEPSKSIFLNSNQSISGNSPLSGNIFTGGNNAASINHDAYSKMEELSEDEIKWFKSNDLDIATMPDKPPTYEMCFT